MARRVDDFNRRESRGKNRAYAEMTPKKIIIHHSATMDSGAVSWGAIRRYHTIDRNWRDIGYHFGIELVGDEFEVLVGRMMDDQGAHTKGHNHNSIGVCFVGNFDTWAPPGEQWQKGLELVRWIMRATGLRAYDVFPHHAFAEKTCPGIAFDFVRFAVEL